MGTTVTIRADEALRKALEARARSRGITISEAAREILREALADRPLASKTAHLRGRLTLGRKQNEAWRKALRERNWRE